MTAYNVINPTNLQPGQPEDVTVVHANLDAIAAILNGGIGADNFVGGKIFDLTKLARGGALEKQALVWDNDAGSWRAGSNVDYVTALPDPATWYDGREVILTDNLTGGTWQWRLRYNLANGRWEFIGGYPKRLAADLLGVAMDSFPAISTYYTSAGVLTWAVPRPGFYHSRVRMMFSNTHLTLSQLIYLQAILYVPTTPTWVQSGGGYTQMTIGATEVITLTVDGLLTVATGEHVGMNFSCSVDPNKVHLHTYSVEVIPEFIT